jgi:hypothetical protein
MKARGVRRTEEVDEVATGDGPQVDEAIGGIGRQIEEIISSAERFADDTRAKAEAEGQELLERRTGEAERAAIEREAAIAELVDRVDSGLRQAVASIDGLREQLLDAAQGLDVAARHVERDLARLTRAGADSADEGDARPMRSGATENGGEGVEEEASKHANPPVVLASQMALSGMSRAEIAETLRTRFAIADPEPIVDRALAREP